MSASMEQSRKLEMRDTTTARMDVAVDAEGNCIMGQDFNMELSSFSGIDGTGTFPATSIPNTRKIYIVPVAFSQLYI